MKNEQNQQTGDTGMCAHGNFPASCEACKVDKEKAKTETKMKRISLAKEFVESEKTFSFPGLLPDVYERMKQEELDFPEYIMTTPIDELFERFQNNEMKVVLGKNPESGNIFVLPIDSDDIEMDSILIQKIDATNVTDKQLKELIVMSQK